MNRAAVTGFTIDPPGSKDIDDAIWISQLGADRYRLEVHIADVAAAVPLGSPADRRAYSRLFTRYYAGGNDPMLAPELSDDALSLVAGKDRRTVTVAMLLNESLDVEDVNITFTTLRSLEQLSYFEADQVIAGSRESVCAHQVRLCDEVAGRLLARRRGAGALAIYDLRSGWRTTEEGQLVRIRKQDTHRANIVIQEFMVLANHQVAKYLQERGVDFLHRVHAGSPADPVRAKLLRAIQDIEGQTIPALEELHRQTLVAFGRAAYSHQSGSHFGLNLPFYTHFTSPIRRYADLTVHRALHALYEPGFQAESFLELPALAGRINERAQRMRDELDARMRKQRHDTAWRRGSGPAELLTKLTSNDFHRVLKIAVADNTLTQSLVDETLRRCDADLLLPGDYYASGLMKFQAELDTSGLRGELVRALLAKVSAHPELAVQILELARQDLGLTYRIDERTEPPYFLARGQATVSRTGRRVIGGQSRALNKKKAKQLAAVALVHGLVGHTPSREEAIAGQGLSGAGTEPPQKKPVPPLQMAKDGNAVGALTQFCQQSNRPQPSYTFEPMRGEPHRPIFACTCECLGQKVSGEGRTRMDAKQAASAALIQKVVEELSAAVRHPAAPPSPPDPR